MKELERPRNHSKSARQKTDRGALNCKIDMCDTIKLDEAGPAGAQRTVISQPVQTCHHGKAERPREALNEQYKLIFKSI